MIATVFALIITILIYIYMTSRKSGNQIPGPRWIPIIGSVYYFKRHNIREFFYDLALSHGKLFQFKLFNTNTVVLNTVEMVKKAFACDGSTFNHRPSLYVGSRLGLLDSVSFLDVNSKYRDEKKILSRNIISYGGGSTVFDAGFQEELKRVVQTIEDEGHEGLEVVDLFQKSTIHVISKLLTGTTSTDHQVKQIIELTSGEDFFLNSFTNALLSSIPCLENLPCYRKRLDKLVKANESLKESLFNCSKSEGELKPGLVQGLLLDSKRSREETGNLPDETVKAIIITDVLSAGFLTSASVLPCIILCLVNNADSQTKLKEELDRIIGHDREPSIDDRHRCHFTEAVIKETMRYITPNPFWLPHCCKTNTEFEGYHISANSQIVANTWFIHHDVNIWGDPWSFRPERFLDAECKILPNDHVYIKSLNPFGVGRRRCPGMEFASSRMFLYISTIFQKYFLTPVQNKCGSCDPRSQDFVFDLLLKPKPFYCFAKRNS